MRPVEEMESSVRSYSRSFEAIFDRASGAELYDVNGRRYLDFLSGAGALNYGHNNQILLDAVQAYLGRKGILHSLDLNTGARSAFLTQLEHRILDARGLDYKVQFTGPTGASAVEAALRLARMVTGRKKVASFTNAYHGVSSGALAATANAYYKPIDEGPDASVFMPYDGYFGPGIDTPSLMETIFSDSASGVQPPAAFIVETVQAEGGIRVCSAKWLQAVAALAKRLGSLLIIDEIQTGCGRCGPFFSFEALNVVPDIVTLSKSIGGLGMPMALLLIRPELDQWRPGQYNGTFRGNNLAFVAGAEAIKRYWSDSRLESETLEKSMRVRQRLEAMCATFFPSFEVRGRGMLMGVDCGEPELAGAIARRAYTEGLIIERCGARDEVLKILPPVVIEEALLSEGLELLAAAMESVAESRTAKQFAGAV